MSTTYCIVINQLNRIDIPVISNEPLTTDDLKPYIESILHDNLTGNQVKEVLKSIEDAESKHGYQVEYKENKYIIYKQTKKTKRGYLWNTDMVKNKFFASVQIVVNEGTIQPEDVPREPEHIEELVVSVVRCPKKQYNGANGSEYPHELHNNLMGEILAVKRIEPIVISN